MTDNAAFDDRPLKERIKQRREMGGEIGAEGSLSAEAADYAATERIPAAWPCGAVSGAQAS